MQYTFMEFLMRELGITEYQSDFYEKLFEVIPFADVEIFDFSMRRIADSMEEFEDCFRLGTVEEEVSAYVNKPEISLYIHKTLSLEKMLALADPEIFGEFRDLTNLKGRLYQAFYQAGRGIPSATLEHVSRTCHTRRGEEFFLCYYKLTLKFPDASAIVLKIEPEENTRRNREHHFSSAPLVAS